MAARAERLLVRLPSWLGDLVAVEPAVRALAESRGAPDGEGLTLACPAHLAPLLAGWLPAARRATHPGRGGERARDWRGHDAALLLTGSFRSAWTAARAGIPRRIGLARDGRGWLLTDGVAPARERGRVPLGCGVSGRWPRYLPRPVATTAAELVALLGVAVRDPVPRLAPPEAAARAVDGRLAALGVDGSAPLLLANVGGREGSAKAWHPEAWAAALAPVDAARVLLVAGPGEEPALERVAAALAGRGRSPAVAWPDRMADLPELLALCARAAGLVTMDSGPRHVARAVGTPTVVLFGPTDPRHTAAPGPREVALRVAVDCGPCHRERCPLRGEAERRCTAALEPARVTAAVGALLAWAREA